MSWLVPSLADHVFAAITRRRCGTRHPPAVLSQLAAIEQVLVFGGKCKPQREKRVTPQYGENKFSKAENTRLNISSV